MEKDLPYRAVTPPPRQRLSDSIASQVEELIVAGTLAPGHELPAERVLAQRFGVSRPSLREALLRLEARGLLKVARGGGFAVTDVTAPTMTDPLVHLLRRHPSAEQDVLEMRHGLELVAAHFAAARATKTDRARLRRAFDRMLKAHKTQDTMAEAQADADFHLSIAEASHNIALIHVMRGIYNLLRTSMHHAWEVMFKEPESVRMLHEQHRALLDAVLGGDIDRARDAAHLHLNFVRESLLQLGKPNRRPAAKANASTKAAPRKNLQLRELTGRRPTKTTARAAARRGPAKAGSR
ncbi:MAG TPA: FCD domain-containing protein [Burkholderiaceae bacterium]|nr:FCD domain-containing protein [Burkholderiaceae bacterium]